MRCMTKLVAEAKVGRGSACHGEAANPLVRLLRTCLRMGRDKKPDAPGRRGKNDERGSGDKGSYSHFMQSIWLPPGYLFSLERDLNAFLCMFHFYPSCDFTVSAVSSGCEASHRCIRILTAIPKGRSPNVHIMPAPIC